MTTEDRVRAVIADVFGMDPAEVSAETSADSIQTWDSLQHLTLVMSLEEEFGLRFNDEETIALTTFPLIVAILGDHLSE